MSIWFHTANDLNNIFEYYRQNDDAHILPNPKPLVMEQPPKFYKIGAADSQGVFCLLHYTYIKNI